MGPDGEWGLGSSRIDPSSQFTWQSPIKGDQGNTWQPKPPIYKLQYNTIQYNAGCWASERGERRERREGEWAPYQISKSFFFFFFPIRRRRTGEGDRHAITLQLRPQFMHSCSSKLLFFRLKQADINFPRIWFTFFF